VDGAVLNFGHLNIRICFGFRASDFGFNDFLLTPDSSVFSYLLHSLFFLRWDWWCVDSGSLAARG